jgi:hypothetical protein
VEIAGEDEARFSLTQDNNNSNFEQNSITDETEIGRNQVGGRDDGSRMASDAARKMAVSRDRRNIRVLEPEVADYRIEYSDDGEEAYERRQRREGIKLNQ